MSKTTKTTTSKSTKSGPNKLSMAENIRRLFEQYPTKKVAEIAEIAGVSYQHAYMTRRDMMKRANKLAAQGHRVHPVTGKIMMQGAEPLKEAKKDFMKIDPKVWDVVHVTTSANNIENAMQIEMLEPASDPVNHPAHYKVGGIETIDFIEAKRLGYNLGNVVKYVTRADHKGNRKQDLEKAKWYLEREIAAL